MLSSSWRLVVPMTVRLAISVTKFRESNSLKSMWRSVVHTTVRAALPSQSSESWFPVPKFQSLSVLARRHSTVHRDYDSPSCDPSTQSVFITVILLLETTKQVITNTMIEISRVLLSFATFWRTMNFKFWHKSTSSLKRRKTQNINVFVHVDHNEIMENITKN